MNQAFTDIKFTTALKEREEMEKRIRSEIIPSARAEVEWAWREWAARGIDSRLRDDPFAYIPDLDERLDNVHVPHGSMAPSDIHKSLDDWMFLWLWAREFHDNGHLSSWEIAPSMTNHDGGDHAVQTYMDECVDSWHSYEGGWIDEDELRGHIATVPFIDVCTVSKRLLFGYWYFPPEPGPDGRVEDGSEILADMYYMPASGDWPFGAARKWDSVQKWAFEYRVREARDNAGRRGASR